MGKVVMGYWDCPVCGKKEIRGDVSSCPSCGRARGDVQFYLKGYGENDAVSVQAADDLEALSKEEAEKIGENPDWYCSFCNSLNKDNAKTCQTCGASRADSEANYFQMLEKNKAKETAELAAQPQVAGSKSNRSRLFIILTAIVLAVVGLIVWLNGRKTAEWKVTSLDWQRNIKIEEYKAFEESGWTLPTDAEYISEQEAVYSTYQQRVGSHTEYYTEQVYDRDEIVGYEQVDRGNGSIELVPITKPVYRTEKRSREVDDYVTVPVMRTKYTYRVWRWAASRVATASGNGHDTSWPEPNLAENEREALENSRSAIYRFSAESMKDTGKTVIYQLNESDWLNIDTGDLVYISVKNSGGGAYLCDADGNRIADLSPTK